jgi:hypothetical protein
MFPGLGFSFLHRCGVLTVLRADRHTPLLKYDVRGLVRRAALSGRRSSGIPHFLSVVTVIRATSESWVLRFALGYVHVISRLGSRTRIANTAARHPTVASAWAFDELDAFKLCVDLPLTSRPPRNSYPNVISRTRPQPQWTPCCPTISCHSDIRVPNYILEIGAVTTLS